MKVTNILFLHAGAEMYGADKVMLDLIRNLDRERYRPIVVLPIQGVLVDALRNEGIEVRVLPYPIMRRKYFNIKGVFQYGFGLIKYSRALVKIAKRIKIDIVHTNTSAVLEGCYISERMRIPQLWSIHEIILEPKLMHKFTSKVIAKYSALAIADSRAVKDHLESSGYFDKGATKVIYNGVDSDHFSPDNECGYLYEEWGIARTARVVGMMGRVNSWKGQGDFLQAANILMEKHPDVYIVFIGSAFEGEEWRETELAERIAASPYRDRIVVDGYRNDSKAIYRLYDVFVLPSTSPDPLPTVVLEAMATGKPIVGYNHGGVCEMVKEGYNGLLAKVGSPEDLAANIDLLLEDESLRVEMGRNSRKRLQECFSIESYVGSYSIEYDRLTETSR